MLTIEPISAFDDNYIWCLYDTESREALVVDPGESEPVIRYLEQKNLQLTSIFVTHHHPDHIGGIKALQQRYSVSVFGPDNPAIDCIDTRLKQGDSLDGLGGKYQILAIPGHTLDHIAFYNANIEDEPRLFCGDTLFAGGCGRLFEGTPSMMLASLNKLTQLPAETQVYCAHEYTLANLAFALAVEPGNRKLQHRIKLEKEKRKSKLATLPTSIELELETNPFLRSHSKEVIHSANRQASHSCTDDKAVFTAIRQWKDNF